MPQFDPHPPIEMGVPGPRGARLAENDLFTLEGANDPDTGRFAWAHREKTHGDRRYVLLTRMALDLARSGRIPDRRDVKRMVDVVRIMEELAAAHGWIQPIDWRAALGAQVEPLRFDPPRGEDSQSKKQARPRPESDQAGAAPIASMPPWSGEEKVGEQLRVTVADGKYTVVQLGAGGATAFRHGEPWRDATGDNLILSLAHEVRSLREQLYVARYGPLMAASCPSPTTT